MKNRNPSNPVQGVRNEGKALIVELAGDIDLHRSPELQQSLMELAQRSPELIVLDLAAVPYMDSSGVASLVKLLTHVRQRRIGLKLCGLTGRVKSMFEITKLDKVFPIFTSGEETLA